MQLDVAAQQASGLKHSGKHCIEYRLDGHGPLRTEWVDYEYDYDHGREESIRRESKNFSITSRRLIKLAGSEERYAHAYLHITVIHQRMITDKRAAEAHIAFDQIKNGFSGWVALEHKSKYAGKIFITAALKGVPGRSSQASSGSLSQAAATATNSSASWSRPPEIDAVQTSSSATGQFAQMHLQQQWPQQQQQEEQQHQQKRRENIEAGLREQKHKEEQEQWDFAVALQMQEEALQEELLHQQQWTPQPVQRPPPEAQSPQKPQFYQPESQHSRHQMTQQSRHQPPQQPPKQVQLQQAGPVQQPQTSEPRVSLPKWSEWPEFLAGCSDADANVKPAMTSEVRVGVRCAPTGGPTCPPTGRRRALLVGVSYAGTPAQLECSVNDVACVKALLLRLGFAGECILCLTEDQSDSNFRPTRRNMLLAMRWLTHSLAAGDVLFFYFSGHSLQHPDSCAGTEEAMDDAVCPSDFQEEGPITENQLFELLVRCLPPSVRLTALVDCCLPSLCLDLPRVLDPGQQGGWQEVPNPYHTLGDVVCISAEPDVEPSMEELTALRSRYSGVITSAFTIALQDLASQRKGPKTYLDLYRTLERRLKTDSRRPRLVVSQPFDAEQRKFRFFDALPNMNEEVGLSRPKKHHWLVETGEEW